MAIKLWSSPFVAQDEPKPGTPEACVVPGIWFCRESEPILDPHCAECPDGKPGEKEEHSRWRGEATNPLVNRFSFATTS